MMARRRRVIVDIETVGCDWDALSEAEREYLMRRADDTNANPAMGEVRARDKLALSGATGEVVLIGMLNPDTGGGRLHLRLAERVPDGALDAAMERVRTISGDRIGIAVAPNEVELLQAFWSDLTRCDQVVTFNGRTFDGAFLDQRSFLLGVEVTRTLVGNRYDSRHIDLMDRLSGFGVVRSHALDFWCRRLGVPSPKEEGSGAAVEQLWRTGELARLCVYNIGDLHATLKLFDRYVRTHGRHLGLDPVGPPS